MTMHLSDEILISRVARGNSRALEILFDRHAAMTLGVLVQILDDRAEAEKVLQETFWQVWQRAEMYSSERGVFTGWLIRMARSLAITEMKAKEKNE